MSDKITIITVVYNAVSTIEKTMLSVLNQTYGNIEYLVIDGGSTDGTVEKIKEFEKLHCSTSNLQPPTFTLRWLSERDDGIYDAMNKGLRLATGEWVNFMNAGDVFHAADTLVEMMSGVTAPDCVDIVYGNSRSVSQGRIVEQYAGPHVETLEHHFFFRHNAALIRREVHLRHVYRTDLKDQLSFSLDYNAIREMYKTGCRFAFSDVCVVDFLKEGTSDHPIVAAYHHFLIAHDLHPSFTDRIRFGISMVKELPLVKKTAHIWEDVVEMLLPCIGGHISVQTLLKLQGAHVGADCRIGADLKLTKPHRLAMGNKVAIGHGCRLDCTGKIIIGEGAILGDGVVIETVRRESGCKNLEVYAPVVIGNNAKIGDGVRLSAGTHVADSSCQETGGEVSK